MSINICTICECEYLWGHACGETCTCTICEECDSPVTITLEPYGSGKMAVHKCPKCGESYDTNLDPTDQLKGENK